MENILEVYARPYDSNVPVVCMDESSIQLIGEVHDPIDAAPGHLKLVDDKYIILLSYCFFFSLYSGLLN